MNRRGSKSTARLPFATQRMGLWRALMLTVCLALTCAAWPAQAEDRPSAQRASRVSRAKKSVPARGSRSAKRKVRARPEATPAPATQSVADNAGRKERATDNAASRAAESAAQGVDSEVVKEGDTSVKVMRFSGLDVEGRLKSPQLLYFVNRVRAEFERPRLPHRSFMPELDRSTRRDPL